MGGNLDIAHWLIVTGVADDGTVRVINSINQRVEYYTQIEFEATMEGQRQRQNINNPDFIFGLMSVT
jgi:3-keto-L-gulonate-6-phosphate decarboxylase